MADSLPIALVGLGNPGAEHARQRHNIGFMAIDHIAREWQAPAFHVKYHGQFSSLQRGTQKIFLLKPDTYMNRSGISVGSLRDFFKLPLENVFVFHDELDLAPGLCRIRIGGGLAGHNGLRSIKEHMGEGFKRVRLGIGHPGSKDQVLGHVLGNFSPLDEWVEPLLEAMAKNAELLLSQQDASFQNKVALAMQAWKKSCAEPPSGSA